MLFYNLKHERRDIITEIKLIGANSKNGIKMCKVIERYIDKNDVIVDLILSNDETSKNKYNVKNYPGIVINDKLVSQGKVLTERELKKLIESN